MQFGMTLAAAAKQAARILPMRNWFINARSDQELVWRPQHVALAVRSRIR